MLRFVAVSSCFVALCACSGAPGGQDEAASHSSSALSASARRAGDADRVFVLGNDPANAVLVFDAADDGSLRADGAFATGGKGSGDGLGSQGALALSGDRHWLLAVNAGSDQVSLLRVDRGGLTLAAVAPSGGNRPVSVAESNGLVYVLNAGTVQNVSGFWIDAGRGALVPIPGSARGLSASTAVGAAQVSFSPDGDALVVTEKATNLIDSFVVRRDGTLTDASTFRSVGDTPFGFAFDPGGALIVSDAFGGAAGAGAMSSYVLGHDAAPALASGPVANLQAAPCWVVATADGRFAYTSNTASGTVSGYAVAADGSLALFHDGGATASTGDGSKPADMALDDEGRLLYVLDGGTHALSSFRIAADGSLRAAGSASGLPAHAVGLVAR
jgi:6-phosphogluconolactonase (cycloisomerase 2 family)